MSLKIKHVLVLGLLMGCYACNSDDGSDLSKSNSAPVVDSVFPESGKTGTLVTISGANFIEDATLNKVIFNETEAVITRVAENFLTTKVPPGATTGPVIVMIGEEVVAGPLFTVLYDPFVLKPNKGERGSEVQIIGQGFSAEIAKNVVKIGESKADLVSASAEKLVMIVPQQASSGIVTVSTNGVIQTGPEFTVVVDQTPENFRIAFIGDTGIGSDAEAVLQLIKSEKADVVIHAGDLDYVDNPKAFEDNITAVLGNEFPYFYSAGNHDTGHWYRSNGYQDNLEKRMNRLNIQWNGDLGVLSSFSYAGIFFVLTAPDVLGTSISEAGDFIRQAMAEDHSLWRISCWHKNQRLMQIGGKSNEAGWCVYEESRKAGAVIATGHEHSYSRTYEMSDFENQKISNNSETITLKKDLSETLDVDEGRAFAFVSGLGGKSIRDSEDNLDQNPWWGSTLHEKNGGQHGALFGEFNHKGEASLAHFYFKDIDGSIRDEFYVRSRN